MVIQPKRRHNRLQGILAIMHKDTTDLVQLGHLRHQIPQKQNGHRKKVAIPKILLFFSRGKQSHTIPI